MLEFHISSTEIRRRFFAYVSLVLFWVGAQFLFTWLFVRQNGMLGLIFLLVLAVALLLLGAITFYFFYTSYIKSVVRLHAGELSRIMPNKHYKLKLADVKSVTTVMTTQKIIRQVSLRTTTGQTHNFDGLEDLKKFRQEIIKMRPKVKLVIRTEKFDYDHTLFYPILGTAMGLFCTLLVYIMTSFSELGQMLFIASMIYTVAVGIFMATAKPLAKQYGPKAGKFDYIVATILVIIPIGLFFVWQFKV